MIPKARQPVQKDREAKRRSAAAGLVRAVAPRRFRGLRIVSIVFAGLLLWLALNVDHLRSFIQAYQERNYRRDSVEALRKQIADLNKQKDSLELGTFENEKSVREAFRLVRPGEKLILVSPEGKPTSGPATRERLGERQ